MQATTCRLLVVLAPLPILSLSCIPWSGSKDDTGSGETGSSDDTGRTEVDWTLAATWTRLSESTVPQAVVGPFTDTDGDGRVGREDSMYVVAVRSMEGPVVLDAEGGPVTTLLADVDALGITLGDVDPAYPGIEMVVTYTFPGEKTSHLSARDETGPLWSVIPPERMAADPWLTDLEGDGEPEALVGAWILRADDGTITDQLDGAALVGTRAVSADLDLDGVEEIVARDYTSQHVGIWEADGTFVAACHPAGAKIGMSDGVAIGDLDGDPEGEVVAAGSGGWIAICDPDGTLVTEVRVAVVQPALIGIGELDGDPDPEVVLGDVSGLFTFEHDLAPLWDRPAGSDWGFAPFTLADLDLDGTHEVILHGQDGLHVLAGDGTELAVLEEPGVNNWKGQPAVADVDADGRLEIVAHGYPGIALVENATGGWATDDVPGPWPGHDRFPGDRGLDGSIPVSDVHWLDPATNVWQGLPLPRR